MIHADTLRDKRNAPDHRRQQQKQAAEHFSIIDTG
jgi:hypothetical protein